MSIVIARIFGGLGNQMFQYAMGRALALRNSVPLLLDVSYYEKARSRRYALDAFRLDARMATVADLQHYGQRRKRGAAALTSFFRPSPAEPVPLVRETSFHFDTAAYGLTPPVCLDGYWQSASYFDDCEDAIRADFSPAEALDSASDRLADAIVATSSVSLHVRRGDYVADPKASRVHGLCSLDYYAKAIKYMAEHVPGAHLYVFSDDMEWTRQNMGAALPEGAAPPVTFVENDRACHEFRDMRLMSLCKHHIVANSSFSWWGAWLNPSASKIVIGPRQWFLDPAKDTRDLVPESWLRF